MEGGLVKLEVEIDLGEIRGEISKKANAAIKRQARGGWIEARVRDEMLKQIGLAVAEGFPKSKLEKDVAEILSNEGAEVDQLISEASIRVKEKLTALEAEIDRLRPKEKFERKIDNHLQWAVLRALGLPYKP